MGCEVCGCPSPACTPHCAGCAAAWTARRAKPFDPNESALYRAVARTLKEIEPTPLLAGLPAIVKSKAGEKPKEPVAYVREKADGTWDVIETPASESQRKKRRPLIEVGA
jgi:hypothetical protein